MKRLLIIGILTLAGFGCYAQTKAKTSAKSTTGNTAKSSEKPVTKTETQPVAQETVTPADDQPYVLATQMPEFPNGGSEGMITFIQENLEYPMAEKQAGIHGTIMMQFIVEKDGSLSDIKAIQSVPGGENLEKEAARVIKLMPAWKPGMQDGHAVRVYKNVPFHFVLAKRRTRHDHNTNTHK